MSLTKLLPVILLMMATGVQASTRDEIERLWNPQGMAAQRAQPAADTSARTEKPAPRWFRLSNGRQVNLADWKVVLFMQGHCPYCHQFDPVPGGNHDRPVTGLAGQPEPLSAGYVPTGDGDGAVEPGDTQS